MDRYRSVTGQKVAAIFVLGFILFNYPVLSIFSTNGFIFGIPVLYVYLFTSWAVIIALMAFVIERQK